MNIHIIVAALIGLWFVFKIVKLVYEISLLRSVKNLTDDQKAEFVLQFKLQRIANLFNNHSH